MKKTLHNWINHSDKDLDEYLLPGDYIDEHLFCYLSDMAPAYASRDLFQVGDPIRSENGVFFYMTMCITPTHRYLKNGHQKSICQILYLKGFTTYQQLNILEMIMGYDIGHTELKQSEIP